VDFGVEACYWRQIEIVERRAAYLLTATSTEGSWVVKSHMIRAHSNLGLCSASLLLISVRASFVVIDNVKVVKGPSFLPRHTSYIGFCFPASGFWSTVELMPGTYQHQMAGAKIIPTQLAAGCFLMHISQAPLAPSRPNIDVVVRCRSFLKPALPPALPLVCGLSRRLVPEGFCELPSPKDFARHPSRISEAAVARDPKLVPA